MKFRRALATETSKAWLNRRDRTDGIVRFEWDSGGPPSAAEWCDTNFLLSEALRDKYEARNLVRLDFIESPDTEDNYRVEAEVAVQGKVPVHPVRQILKWTKSRKDRPGNISAGLPGETIPFVPHPVGDSDLSSIDRELLERFRRLPLQDRIRFWQQNVARYFV